MKTLTLLSQLSDAALLAETIALASRERTATTHLVAALAELDARRLYLGEGCSSLFGYCTRVLRLSEHAAYGRIEAARAARRFPVILELLQQGTLTLTTIGLLAPHLTTENHVAALDAAKHKTKREVEEQVAALRPLPAVPCVIRKLPGPKPSQAICPPEAQPIARAPGEAQVATPAPPLRPAVVKPLAPERYKVQFTIRRETHDKLRRAQDLLRHTIPNGDPAEIFDKALTLLLAEIERKKLAATERPQANRTASFPSRHIPASVRRAVWKRDGGQCALVGTRGRCEERGFLEFHHVEPFAAGGTATVENVELRCRAHNVYEADLFFGPREPMVVRESRIPFRATNSVQPDRAGGGGGSVPEFGMH